jgi:hypothetical protein
MAIFVVGVVNAISIGQHHEALVYAILWWCCGLKNSPTSFRVLSF